MCDTIGKIIDDRYAIFGKNSDRAVNERQVVEFYPSKDYEKGTKLKCTYIEIDQALHTNAIVLSRPTWMWGGEIGVNEFGVCIGNEAVFTKGKYGKESLIGMDYLRLALERSKTSFEALQVIIELLQKYDQGGNCGYDSKFEYNNSFLIMDRKEIYILETVGKEFVYKKSTHYSISNCLSIGKEGDYYSSNVCNFKKKYSDFIMTFGSQGKTRRKFTSTQKLDTLNDMIKILSSHDHYRTDVFKKGSVSSVCMHASNSLTADQTSMSMIVELINDEIRIWITGSSLPCISLYKPHEFKVNGLIFEHSKNNDDYWLKHEDFNRRLLSHKLPIEYYIQKSHTQSAIIDCVYEAFNQDTIKEAFKFDDIFFNYWLNKEFEKEHSNFIYKNFWKKKNKELHND